MAPRFSELCADLLKAGIAVRFTATGPSMWPTIRDGDAITVAPVSEHEVSAGDVVLYRARRGLVVHRVAHVLGTGRMRCRGDAPGSRCEAVEVEDVLGRLVHSGQRRRLAGILRFLRRPGLRTAGRRLSRGFVRALSRIRPSTA